MLHAHYWRATILILAVVAAGCSQEARDKIKGAVVENVEKVKEIGGDVVEKTTDQAQQTLNLAGNIELTAGEPLKTNACYVSLIPQGSGRPTVLQLQSYRNAESESFPSVFLQAHVQANSLTELIDEPLAARLFVQREAQGPILFSDIATPVELKITSVDDKLVSFELTGTKLRDTVTGAEIPVTGSMTGVLE